MTGDPGVSSLRPDAGLVTCQVHDHATLRRCHLPWPRRHSTGPPRHRRPPSQLISRTGLPRGHASCRSRATAAARWS